jgi:hypothetical protein
MQNITYLFAMSEDTFSRENKSVKLIADKIIVRGSFCPDRGVVAMPSKSPLALWK